MADIINADDLTGLMPADWSPGQVQAEIESAVAWVRIYVKCLDYLDANGLAAVKAVLRKAIPYNAKMATATGGTVNRVNAGPMSFSTETTSPRDSGGYFSPAQITALSGLCGSGRAAGGTIMTRPL